MGWMTTVGQFGLTTAAWLAGLALAFAVLVRLMPCNPGMYWWKDRRAAAADLLYWLLVPLVARLGRTLLLIAGVVLLFGGREPHLLPVADRPLWQQCVAVLLVQDLILYWMHRLFHTRTGWSFHAVHHSPAVLDWTVAARFHPVNVLLEFGLADVAVLLAGFSPRALLLLAPFNVVYSAMVHANLNWTFGPLRYLLASPVFHRWHHTTREEALDRNFASTFPFLDLVFGTFYMPRGVLPAEFGNGSDDYPEGFWAQLIRPFCGAERTGGSLLVAAGLGVAVLAGGGFYYRGLPVERGRAPEHSSQAEQIVRLDMAPRVWSGSHLVAASAVTCVALTADGRRIASGDEGGVVKVWDATAEREPLVCPGHAGRVSSVAFTADGSRLVSGGVDGTVRVWDAATGEENRRLAGHGGPVLSAAVSADGRRVVSGSADGTVRVWDATMGREALRLATDTDAVTGVAVSADGRLIVAANFKVAQVWDADVGHELATLNGHADLVYGVAISPDGRRAVTGSFDGSVRVWDVPTGRAVATFQGHAESVYGLAISPDGRHVVSGSNDGTVRVWDVQTGREERTLTGHADTVTGVAVSADGGRIVSGSRDGTVRLWDARAPI
jgi:sterol desaturase/sphingolipid hydroxylase (fatty acid hydroxylase superfamily)